MKLSWYDLTKEEKEQAENSFLSIMEDVQFDDNDEWNNDYYESLKADRDFRLEMLKGKSFIRDNNGYIFVNI